MCPDCGALHHETVNVVPAPVAPVTPGERTLVLKRGEGQLGEAICEALGLLKARYEVEVRRRDHWSSSTIDLCDFANEIAKEVLK